MFPHAGRYGSDNFVTPNGVPVPAGTQVTVYLSDGVTLATIYADKDRAAKANPFAMGDVGNVTFHAEPGEYRISIDGSSIPVVISPWPADLEGTAGNVALVDETNTFTEMQKLYADLPVLTFDQILAGAEFTVLGEFGMTTEGGGLGLAKFIAARIQSSETPGEVVVLTALAYAEMDPDESGPTGRYIISAVNTGQIGGSASFTNILVDNLQIANLFDGGGTTLPVAVGDPALSGESSDGYAASRGWVDDHFFKDLPVLDPSDPDAEFSVVGQFGDATDEGDTPTVLLLAAKASPAPDIEIFLSGLAYAEFGLDGSATGRYVLLAASTGIFGNQAAFSHIMLEDLKISNVFGDANPTSLPLLTSDPTPVEGNEPATNSYAATQGWVRSKIAEIPTGPNFSELNVVDFGAVLDGVADDWPAIDAALLEAAATGKDVYIPEGTALVTRTVVVPGGVRLRGAGMDRTTVTRPASVGTTIVGHVEANVTSVEVADASMFSIGNPIHLWDIVHYEGDDTRRYVTAVDSDPDPDTGTYTITFDLPTLMDYDESIGGRVSTSFALICSETDTEHGAISDMTVDQNMSDFDPKGTFSGGDIQVEFTLAAIHLEQARYWKVERVRFINAFGDAYSDQGRANATGSNHNELAWCEIIAPFRHGIHLGTYNDGSRIHHNTVTGVDAGFVFFFCAAVTNCVVEANFFVDSSYGLCGIDQRDTWNVITNNTFWNVSKALLVQGQSEDPTLAFGLVVEGNVFYADQDSPITVGLTVALPNVVFTGNRMHNQFLRVAQGADKCLVDGNIMSGDADYSRLPPDGSEWRMWVEANDVTITDNSFQDFINGAVQIMGGNRMVARGNRVTGSLINNPGWAFALAESTDCIIDGGSHQPDDHYDDPDGLATRLLFNGLGSNGANDPNEPSAWYNPGAVHSGTMVRHGTGGISRLSVYVHGTGWIQIGSVEGG